MRQWTRTAPLDASFSSHYLEKWECWEDGECVVSYDMDVTCGKALDILALRGTSLREIREYAEFLKKTVSTLYTPERKKNCLKYCPCCEHGLSEAGDAIRALGILYQQCSFCGHVFVADQPTEEDLYRIFKESDEYANVYTDPAALKVRLEEIIRPKIEWMTRVFEGHYDRVPKTVLDVGAGGGHFVEGCRRAGLEAQGIELNQSCVDFAKRTFGFDLLREDFLSMKTEISTVELVSFWGLLEYLPNPKKFLIEARKKIELSQGMVIVEVPRFHCLSSAVQKEFPEAIARHLSPATHMNCFSDASLAELFYSCGLKPVSAWYFGMDMYETLIQLGLASKQDGMLSEFASIIPGIQSFLDQAKLCDDLIIACAAQDFSA